MLNDLLGSQSGVIAAWIAVFVAVLIPALVFLVKNRKRKFKNRFRVDTSLINVSKSIKAVKALVENRTDRRQDVFVEIVVNGNPVMAPQGESLTEGKLFEIEPLGFVTLNVGQLHRVFGGSQGEPITGEVRLKTKKGKVKFVKSFDLGKY